ncbi:MAG: hypothetical protein QXK17_06455 [Metallosphaera sp.]
MRTVYSTIFGIIHSISGVLALISLPIAGLGIGSLPKISSIVGLFLALYFISGVAMVYETYVVVMEANSIYTSSSERFKAYIESHPVNSPVYLYGYQSISNFSSRRENGVKLMIVLLMFSIVNEIPLVNIIPLVYYIGREYGRIRNLLVLQSQLGFGGGYFPDTAGLELATIITNGLTLGMLTKRLILISQALLSSPLQQGPGPGPAYPPYGGGSPSP